MSCMLAALQPLILDVVHCAATTPWNNSHVLGCGERKRRRKKKKEKEKKRRNENRKKINYLFLEIMIYDLY
jgi:hypothetical protein